MGSERNQYKWKYFKKHWGSTEKGREDLIKAEQAFQKLWESHKASWLAAQMEPSLPSAVPTPRVAMPEYSLVRNYVDQIHDNSDSSDDETDEYQAYLAQKTLKQKPTNLFSWWISKAEEWPCLASLAFTVLSIPAMSTEVERVFIYQNASHRAEI